MNNKYRKKDFMRQEQFKMERQGLIQVGDVVEISEFQSYIELQLYY